MSAPTDDVRAPGATAEGPAAGASGAPEGPMAYAARLLAEHSYLSALERSHQQGRDRAAGGQPETMSKRWLVALSHSLEKAVMSGPVEDPTVVVSLFQEMAFFDREREVYRRMAAAGFTVVVGFVSGEAHDLPEGVTGVVLDRGEPLADEWTVVAVGPRAGAFLVATDQHGYDPRERGHQASRRFRGRWGYSRAQAGAELARLRLALGDRLDPAVRRTVDGLLTSVLPSGDRSASSAGTPGELWATTSLYHLVDGLVSLRAGNQDLRDQLVDAQHAAAARASATHDPESGLPTADFLARWPADPGTTTLPVGLALFDVAALARPAIRSDRRGAYLAAHRAAAALTVPLGPVDAVVRLSPREFLVIVPGANATHLAGIVDEVAEGLELSGGGYPDGIGLRARTATIVTRTRPFPLDDLRTALAHLDVDVDATADLDGHGPFDAGVTPAGERIVVATTARHGGTDRWPAAEEPERPRLALAPEQEPAPPTGPGDGLPHRTAQEALQRAMQGAPGGGDPADVFADVGIPQQAHRGLPPA